MINTTYFAGFVCDYSFDEQWMRYLLALGIALMVAVLIAVFRIRHIKARAQKNRAIVALALLVFIGWHAIYMLSINGDFMGCGFYPTSDTIETRGEDPGDTYYFDEPTLTNDNEE